MDFEEFWKEKSRRFQELHPLESSCRNKLFPWTLSESGCRCDSPRFKRALSRVRNIPEYSGIFQSINGEYSLWDRALCFPRQTDNVLPMGQSLGEYDNTDWLNILENLNNVSVSDGRADRPHGDFIYDITKARRSWEMLEVAHILTHKTVRLTKDWSATSNVFAGYLFKVMLALHYGLVLDTSPEQGKSNTLDSLDKRGIRISVGTRLRQPKLAIPCTGPNTLHVDKDLVVLCGTVHFEPQPVIDNLSKGKWLEVNRWSCEPTLACFAGWQTVDWITHAQLTQGFSKSLFWEMAVQSLEPPSVFGGFMETWNDSGDNVRFFRPEDYLNSPKFLSDRKVTPALPCKSCMRINPRIEGAPRSTEETYEQEMAGIHGVVAKAAEYHQGRLLGHRAARTIRRRGNANARKLEAARRKIEQLRKRRSRKLEQGYLSEAGDLLDRIREQERFIEELQ